MSEDTLADARQQLINMTHQMEYNLQTQALFAKMLRSYYDALVREGFSETQALEIIKARGLKVI